MNKDLTVGKPSQVLWQFCLPMFGSIIFQQLYNIADSLVAGKFIGENALAAVGNSYEITLIFIAFAFGCNIGCSVIVSRYFGAKEYREMKTSVYTSLIGSAVLCAVLMGIGLFGCDACWSSSTPRRRSLQILRCIWISTFWACPSCSSTTLPPASSLPLATARPPSTSLQSLLCPTSAWTSCSSPVSRWASPVWHGLPSVSGCQLRAGHGGGVPPHPRFPHRGSCAAVLVEYAGQGGRGGCAQHSAAELCLGGQHHPAEHHQHLWCQRHCSYSAAVKLNNMVITSFTTLGNGISNYTSQNMGAGKMDRVKEGFGAGRNLVWLLCVPLVVLYFFFGRFLLLLFMNDPQGPAIDTGMLFLRILSPFYFVVSVKLVADGILRGCGLDGAVHDCHPSPT